MYILIVSQYLLNNSGFFWDLFCKWFRLLNVMSQLLGCSLPGSFHITGTWYFPFSNIVCLLYSWLFLQSWRNWRNLLFSKISQKFDASFHSLSAFEFHLWSRRQHNCRRRNLKTFILAVPWQSFCHNNQTNLCICFTKHLGTLWQLPQECLI